MKNTQNPYTKFEIPVSIHNQYTGSPGNVDIVGPWVRSVRVEISGESGAGGEADG